MHAETSLVRSPDTIAETSAQPAWVRWLLPMAALIVLAGYVGPWVPHAAAGLVVTGLDLAEYVKFLHPIRTGEINLWREGFYLPLVAVSLALSLNAYRHDLRYPWPLKVFFLGIATVAALNLLPPAWSPTSLSTPEFRLQTVVLVCCVGTAAISPMLALLPRRILALGPALLTLAAVAVPAVQFWRILPAIETIYAHTITPGWGLWAMLIGLAGLLAALVAASRYPIKGSRS